MRQIGGSAYVGSISMANAFSEGARYEWKAILAKVRREIRDSERCLTYTARSMSALEEWILERRKRYELKPGELGRKK